MYTLQAFKEDTLKYDITAIQQYITLDSGIFGSPDGEQFLVIDYDNDKREIIKCGLINGASVTSITRGQDGTIGAAHTAGAKVIMAFVPSHFSSIFTTIDTKVQALYPVGSIYINATVATNPATLLGFGTWAAFGSGRVMVGVDAGQTEFDALGETGGEKTHTLTTTEMPAHSHGVTDPGHNHSQEGVTNANEPLGGGSWVAGHNSSTLINPTASNTTGISIQNNGSGGAHNNLQPYITVYMWKRTL